MNVQPTDCLQNPQIDAYLDLVKSYLQADRIAFACFLANLSFLVKELHSYRPNAPSTSNYHSIIVDLASKLKKRPKLLYGLNVLLPEDQRLDCSLSPAEVRYFVISDPRSSTIYSTSSPKVPYPSSCRDLREVVCSPSGWSQLLNSNPDKEWLVCISHLLQEILDDPSTEPALYTKAYRCLRELASRCILPPSIFLNNLRCTTGDVVQGGAFADIYQGDIDGKLVCLRVLRMFGSDRETLFKDFCSEVLVWHQLRHPNILLFIGADLDLFPGRFCFVSPWMNNGDIMSYLKKHPDHDRFKAVCEIAEGIDYLHSLKPPVTHRDIKGANVLVGDDLICCLADFGLSSIVESQRLGKGSPAFEGSVCWAAPEIIQPSCSVPKNAPAGDIYALGCTIYEIYTGKPPFSQYNNAMAVMMAVVEGKRPKVPPPGSWTNDELQLWSLVELCWKAAPGERPEMYLIKRSLQDTERYEVTRRKPTSEPLRRVNRGVSVEAVSNWLQRERMQEKNPSSYTCHPGLPMSSMVGRETFAPPLSNPPRLSHLHSGNKAPSRSVDPATGLLTPTTPSFRPLDHDDGIDSTTATFYETQMENALCSDIQRFSLDTSQYAPSDKQELTKPDLSLSSSASPKLGRAHRVSVSASFPTPPSTPSPRSPHFVPQARLQNIPGNTSNSNPSGTSSPITHSLPEKVLLEDNQLLRKQVLRGPRPRTSASRSMSYVQGQSCSQNSSLGSSCSSSPLRRFTSPPPPRVPGSVSFGTAHNLPPSQLRISKQDES